MEFGIFINVCTAAVRLARRVLFPKWYNAEKTRSGGDRMDRTGNAEAYLIRNAAIIFAALFVNQTLQTLGAVLTARLIANQTLFGEVSVMQQVLGMSSLFLNLGLNTATTFFIAKHGRRAAATTYAPGLWGSVVAAVLLGLILSALSPAIASAYRIPALAPALVAGSGILAVTAAINMGVAVFSGMRRFFVQASLMVIATLFSVAGTVLGVIWAAGRTQALYLINIAVLGMDLFVLIISLLWVYKSVGAPLFVRLRSRGFRQMLRYGLPNWAGNVAKAFQQSYLVIITGAASVVSAGYLNNALKIAGYLNIVTWALNVVALPFLSQVIRSRKDAGARATLCFRYNNFILFPMTLGICLFPREILLGLYGAHYVNRDAVLFTIFSAVGVLLSSVARLGGTLLAGLGQPRANFWTMVVSGMVVFFAVPLAAMHRPVLATVVYAAGWCLSAVALFFFLLLHDLRLQWREAFFEPLLPALAAGLMLEAGQRIPVVRVPADLLALLCVIGWTWHLERRRRMQNSLTFTHSVL